MSSANFHPDQISISVDDYTLTGSSSTTSLSGSPTQKEIDQGLDTEKGRMFRLTNLTDYQNSCLSSPRSESSECSSFRTVQYNSLYKDTSAASSQLSLLVAPIPRRRVSSLNEISVHSNNFTQQLKIERVITTSTGALRSQSRSNLLSPRKYIDASPRRRLISHYKLHLSSLCFFTVGGGG